MTEPPEQQHPDDHVDAMVRNEPERSNPPHWDEIEQALVDDETRLGDVFRLTRQGLDPGQIAAQLEVPTAGFVYSYRAAADALLKGKLPTSPVQAGQIAARARKWIKTGTWSPATLEHLRDLESKLEAISEAPDNRAAESKAVTEKTTEQESKGTPGVYVYTYPHYLRYPFEPDTERTLLKVGQSGVDAAARAVDQVKGAFVPEEPWLLRVYTSADPRQLEVTMHRLLDAADHERSRGKRAGKEWFVTSTKFLDEVAKLAGAVVDFTNEFEVLAD